MKRLSLAMLLFPAFCVAQIEKVETDRFTGQKRIKSEWTNVIKDPTHENIENLYLRSIDTVMFLSLSGTLGVGVVNTNDAAVFLFDDKSKFQIFPTSIQTYDALNVSPKYDQQYSMTRQYLEMLSVGKLVAIRRYFNENYIDIDVDDASAAGLKNLALVFLKELDKK